MTIPRQAGSKRKLQRRRTGGTVTVELAIVAPILIALMFGIIEMGLLMNHVLSLKQAAREGARIGATGVVISEISNSLRHATATLDPDALQIQLHYRPYGAPDHMDFWEPLGDTYSDGHAHNDAPSGSYIRVALAYPHQLLTGRLFSRLADDPNGQIVTLSADAVMLRE